MEKEIDRNLNDTVWIMHDDAVVCGVINSIEYIKVLSSVDYETITEITKYEIRNSAYTVLGKYESTEIYSSKEELIKSL